MFPWRVLSAQPSPFQALITITKTTENSGARKWKYFHFWIRLSKSFCSSLPCFLCSSAALESLLTEAKASSLSRARAPPQQKISWQDIPFLWLKMGSHWNSIKSYCKQLGLFMGGKRDKKIRRGGEMVKYWQGISWYGVLIQWTPPVMATNIWRHPTVSFTWKHWRLGNVPRYSWFLHIWGGWKIKCGWWKELTLIDWLG